MSNKKYRLLKDIDCPDLKAKEGTIGELNEQSGKVWFGEEKQFFYNLATVLSATGWFAEILPEHNKEFEGKEFGTPFEQIVYWATHSGWRYCQQGQQCGNEPILKLSHFKSIVARIIKEQQPPQPSKESIQDWEVMAVKKNSSGTIFNLDVDRCDKWIHGMRREWMLSQHVPKDYSIHSVKRLSTNEIFTDKEIVEHSIFGVQTISGFFIDGSNKNRMLVRFHPDMAEYGFSEISKLPSPSAQQPEENFLKYLVSQKEKFVREQDFETASQWRLIERLYRQHLLLNKRKPVGRCVTIEEIVEEYLSKQKNKP